MLDEFTDTSGVPYKMGDGLTGGQRDTVYPGPMRSYSRSAGSLDLKGRAQPLGSNARGTR